MRVGGPCQCRSLNLSRVRDLGVRVWMVLQHLPGGAPSLGIPIALLGPWSDIRRSKSPAVGSEQLWPGTEVWFVMTLSMLQRHTWLFLILCRK